MKKLAVIGTGVAGLSAAYFLKDEFELSVFEKNNYAGGHTNTVDVFDGVKSCPLDTGFMVFNENTYPNLLKLFHQLGVVYENTDMSFSVWHEKSGLEYNGSNFDGLFSQRKNIFNISFLRMLGEIVYFNKRSIKMMNDPAYAHLTIKQYIKKLKLSPYFLEKFLVPMSAAVWSTPADKMLDFPAQALVRFFYNHGFLGVNTQFQWKTVTGGSRQYRDKITSFYKDKIRLNTPALSVEQVENGAYVITSAGKEYFDKVIIATHGDEALKLLSNPKPLQAELLQHFKYQENIATVHSDESVMPTLRKNWSSWNYAIRGNDIYTVYFMNSLQGVSERQNFFVNINGEQYINPNKIHQRIVYHHPLFDVPAIRAQERLSELNERDGAVNFCGSYFRYGFHEDALKSSVELCEHLLQRKVLS